MKDCKCKNQTIMELDGENIVVCLPSSPRDWDVRMEKPLSPCPVSDCEIDARWNKGGTHNEVRNITMDYCGLTGKGNHKVYNSGGESYLEIPLDPEGCTMEWIHEGQHLICTKCGADGT